MEIEFRRPRLEDQETVKRYLSMEKTRSCEYTFANVYLWARHYEIEFAVVEEMVVFRYPREEGYPACYFSCPQGKRENRGKVIRLLMQWCEERGLPFALSLVTPEQFAEIEELYPGRFSIAYMEDASEYVYETEKLSQLSGKKYHGKKNHVNKFQKLYPDWSYEKLSDSNVEECFQMALGWRRENGCDEDPEKNEEMCVSMNALRLYKELGLTGGALRVQGQVVAFTIGEPICDDTFVVHIEKAYAWVEGAYTVINQQFLLHEVQDYRYVNREDDAGDPGLRQAKQSYHPAFMVVKGTVEEKKETVR